MSKHTKGSGTVDATYSVANDHGEIHPTSLGAWEEQLAGFEFETADKHQVLVLITWRSRPAPGQYNLADPSGNPYHLKMMVDNTAVETGTLKIDLLEQGSAARIRGSFHLTTDRIAHYNAKMTINCSAFDIRK